MPLIRDDAIILQSFSYSDTSKILRLMTRSHGVRSVIAKGALRPRSRFGGVLEPFTDGVVEFYAKRGRDLHTLSGFDLTRSRQMLGRDLVRFGGASLLAELVLRTANEVPEPALFEQLGRGLGRVEHAPAGELESVALAECWALVARLGFAPSLEVCIGCERALGEAEAAVFDYRAGGVRCPTCTAGSGGTAVRALPVHARRTLVRFCRGEAVPLDRTAAHWRLLGRFLAYHVVEGDTLRSLAFLQEAMQDDPCEP